MGRLRILRSAPASALALVLAGLVSGTALAAPENKPSQSSLNESVEVGVRQAQASRAAGDFAGAVKILSQLMLVNADDGRVVSEYGKVLTQQGRSREAIDFLKRAVQLSPQDWTLYSALGVAYDGGGDYANAKIAYDHALLLKPGEPAVLNNFALSRTLAGDLTAAKTMISQASAGSKDPRVLRNVALISGLTNAQPAAASQANATQKTLPAKTAKAAPAPGSTPAVPPAAIGASGPPRPLTSSEGAKVVMQAIPVDPKAGLVKKPAPVKTADKSLDKPVVKPQAPLAKPAAKPQAKQGDGVPALRLSGDRL